MMSQYDLEPPRRSTLPSPSSLSKTQVRKIASTSSMSDFERSNMMGNGKTTIYEISGGPYRINEKPLLTCNETPLSVFVSFFKDFDVSYFLDYPLDKPQVLTPDRVSLKIGALQEGVPQNTLKQIVHSEKLLPYRRKVPLSGAAIKTYIEKIEQQAQNPSFANRFGFSNMLIRKALIDVYYS